MTFSFPSSDKRATRGISLRRCKPNIVQLAESVFEIALEGMCLRLQHMTFFCRDCDVVVTELQCFNFARSGACRAKTDTFFGECLKHYLTADTQLS